MLDSVSLFQCDVNVCLQGGAMFHWFCLLFGSSVPAHSRSCAPNTSEQGRQLRMQFGKKGGDCGERKKWSVLTNIGVKQS